MKLPERVFRRFAGKTFKTSGPEGTYALVIADGKKRRWRKLSPARLGVPEMLRRLWEEVQRQAANDRVGQLVDDWMRDVMSARSAKTQVDDTRRCADVKKSFAEFKASDVSPPDVADFLRQWASMPRTYNAYRALVRDLMRYAEERGYRSPGSNPVTPLRTMSTPPRDRYVTDSELRRIKVACLYSDARFKARVRTAGGKMMCALLEVAYLSGQRVGDVLALRWRKEDAFEGGKWLHGYVSAEGLMFKPSKTSRKTGASMHITMTPRLAAVLAYLKTRRGICRQVFVNEDGQPLTYTAANSAWRRARARLKLENTRLNDMRAKALTDKDDAEGIGEARKMGGHSTEAQTSDYTRHKKPRKTGATR